MDMSLVWLYLLRYKVLSIMYSSPTRYNHIIGCLRHSIRTGKSDIYIATGTQATMV